jgi:hypothetical protein
MMFRRMMFVALTSSTFAFAADPFVGTWKPDVAKWKTSPGLNEAVKSDLVTLEASGKDQYRRTFTTFDGKRTGTGNPRVWHVDGKEYKQNGVTSKIERIDERHWRFTQSSSKGSVVNDWVVSPDGKTLTITRNGFGVTIGRIDEVWIYDKQPAK